MAKRHLTTLAAGVALVLVVNGCGSSGSASSKAAIPPTKAEFIKGADAICVKSDGRQKRAQLAFQKKYPEANSSKPWEEKIIAAAGLPPVQLEAEELSRLTAPRGDEAEVKAIVEGMEDALGKSEAEPSALLKAGSAGPFTEVEKLAQEYGLKACARPL